MIAYTLNFLLHCGECLKMTVLQPAVSYVLEAKTQPKDRFLEKAGVMKQL